jgi:hypothetical protein
MGHHHHKHHHHGHHHGGHEGAGDARGAHDPKTAKAVAASGQLGNDEMNARLHAGKATRDEMIQFVLSHVKLVREAQVREVTASQPQEMRKLHPWLGDPMDTAWHKPEPKRWMETAQLYDDAMLQLCRGSLARAAELMDRALVAERKAFDGMSDKFKEPEMDEALDNRLPFQGILQSSATVDDTEDLTEGPQREAFHLIHEILNVTTDPKDLPVHMRNDDPFYLDEEEEDEEGKPPGGGGGAGA